jgi:hypothetical protein
MRTLAQPGAFVAAAGRWRAIAVQGTVDKGGVLPAENIQRAKDSSIPWPVDRWSMPISCLSLGLMSKKLGQQPRFHRSSPDILE